MKRVVGSIMLLAGICCAAPLVLAILELSILPSFVWEPVEPLLCEEGWELVTETQPCGSNIAATCSTQVCVSPDGERVDKGGLITMIQLGIGASAVILIGGGALLGRGPGGSLTLDLSGGRSRRASSSGEEEK